MVMTASQISIILIATAALLNDTKTYLNARSYLTNVKDFQEHACRKIEVSDRTCLHIQITKQLI